MRTTHLLIVLGTVVSACSGDCMDIRPPELPPQSSILLDPDNAAFDVTAPDTFRVRFETTAGPFVIEVIREWAPLGADRFHALITNGFYDDVAFFRVLPGFVAQWGLHGVPAVNDAWAGARIPDDPVRASNTQGTVTYAKGGADTRTTQLFVNFGDNSRLDALGFAPFARVVEGLDAVLAIHAGYGELAPNGSGPDLTCMQQGGNNYLRKEFGQLDFIESATVTSQ